MFSAIASLFKGIFTGDWGDFIGDRRENAQYFIFWLIAGVIIIGLTIITQNMIAVLISVPVMVILFFVMKYRIDTRDRSDKK